MADPSTELDPEYRPPMANGEVLFEEPWQGRVFAMAVALSEAGHFSWAEFQAALIQVIGEWDAAHGPDEPYAYYTNFARALNELLQAKGIVGTAELDARKDVLAARPHGHDH